MANSQRSTPILDYLIREKLTDKWIAILSVIAGLALLTFAWNEYWLGFAIPFLMFFGFIAFLKPDLIWYIIPVITPLSINPSDVDLGKLSISIPSEPLLVILVLLFFNLLVFRPKAFHPKVFTHPVSFIIYIYLIWMLVTACTSVDKLISIKYFVAKIWFILPMFFISNAFFQNKKNIPKFLFLFIVGISVVCIYNVVHLSFYGFADRESHYTMQPFFKDHTVLSSVVALALPVLVSLLMIPNKIKIMKVVLWIFLIFCTICFIVTYSRGAWLSLIPAILFPLLIKWGFQFKHLLLLLVVGGIFIFANFDDLVFSLEQNKVASSDDFSSNIESISNISTDDSNLERINRWACAIEMWKVKPHFGWGPGTYMFEYAPFQYSYNYTSLSTNNGEVGNAHSEYLGALAESGWPGFLIFVLLVLAILKTAFVIFKRNFVSQDRIIAMGVICGLISYFIHGLLNNYLDTDKASVVFWSYAAILVSIHLNTPKSAGQSSSHQPANTDDQRSVVK